jgi:DNA polymerase III subunit delta'
MAWQVIGHSWAVALLSQSLATGRLAHAYLFTGPPQVGKTTLARAWAQALNCAQPDPPCGRCPSCRKVERDVHPDVRLVVGQGAGEAIRIEQIRTLQREATLAPYEGRRRVLILRQMDRASTEAANSLLKILEEPPGHVVLILTAPHAETLPATVVSRCQRLELRPVSEQVLEAALRGRGCPPPHAHLLARLSGGCPGWALEAATEGETLRRRGQDLDRLSELFAADRVARLDFAAKMSQNAVRSRQLLNLWITWWRDLLLLVGRPAAVGHGTSGISHIDRCEELAQAAAQASLLEAVAGLRALQTTAAQLEANVNARLALEGLVLSLPHWQLGHAPGELGKEGNVP